MGSRTRVGRLGAAVAVTSLISAAMVAASTTARADHPAEADPSTGIYRIPYENGTSVTVSNDHHAHSPRDALDMVGGLGTPVVAAASGWIRAIVDIHGEDPNDGDGRDVTNTLNPGHDALEHSCGNDPDAVVGSCTDYNNYVWIEHPNGEWTKYTHLGTGTVTSDNGWEVGDWIEAGEEIGLEGDVGQATGGPPANHLHFEVRVPADANDPTPFADSAFVAYDDIPGGGNPNPSGAGVGYYAGGFILNSAERRVPRFCGIPGGYLDDDRDPDANPDDFPDVAEDPDVNEPYTAEECDHEPPMADAGGPYVVDEGTTFQLDGSGSSDPEGRPLTFLWGPDHSIDDPAAESPTYDAVDDAAHLMVLQVFDQVEALRSTAITTVIVNNVAPTVTANDVIILEGGTAVVSATIEDPGVEDTFTVTIDWGDGTPLQEGDTGGDLVSGIPHAYGDNGDYAVEITVTDDDGGVGSDTAIVSVGNVPPDVDLDVETVTFPGGDHAVVAAGEELPAEASAFDEGSDDLTFSWSTGDVTTYFNDGMDTDPFPSPLGTYPFEATDAVQAVFGEPGAEPVAVTVTDDDAGTAEASVSAVVVGTAEDTQGDGWWKHQYAGTGSPQLDDATLAGYLETVAAVSSVFDEAVAATSAAEAHSVLSPTNDKRDQATAELLLAWLQFASGAVAVDATVPLQGGALIGFLDLMFAAEAVILDGAATNADLNEIRQQLSQVRHAE